MAVGTDDLLAAAAHLADTVLWPAALTVDDAPRVPARNLRLLAEAGLYGAALQGSQVIDEAAEILASGCLATTFVWIQHHALVRMLLTLPDSDARRRRWLPDLCAGHRTAAVAFSHLRRPGPSAVMVRRDSSGWSVDGTAPWVTGWGIADLLLLAARDDDGRIVWLVLDAREEEGLSCSPISLAAVNASSTVTLGFTGLHVDEDRCLLVEEDAVWRARDAASLRRNGFLSLGLVRRCAALLGSDDLSTALRVAHERLARDVTEAVPAARAAAARLAHEAAWRVMVEAGARGITTGHHAQMLVRQAAFLQVFAQTPAIRDQQRRLTEEERRGR